MLYSAGSRTRLSLGAILAFCTAISLLGCASEAVPTVGSDAASDDNLGGAQDDESDPSPDDDDDGMAEESPTTGDGDGDDVPPPPDDSGDGDGDGDDVVDD